MRTARVAFGICFLLGGLATLPAAAGPDAADVVRDKGIPGGLAVHLDCGDAESTAALDLGERFLVQGLDRRPALVAAARRKLRDAGTYGPLTVRAYDGKHLPYINRTVNVLIAGADASVPEKEMLRVLTPGGIVLIGEGDGWRTRTRPRSPETDDWTHYLYDATGNAVSEDAAVAPPFYVQWYSSPKWARSHDRLTSMPALVSSAGKIFYIMDEGPREDIILPADWKLIAKDAYNGRTLWKRPIERWENHLRAFRSGPTQQPRRLVSEGNRLYAALNLGDPVQAIDGSTGRTVATFAQTAGAEEMILSEGTLFVVADCSDMRGQDDTSRYGFDGEDRRGRTTGGRGYYQKAILALNAESGSALWRRDDEGTAAIIPSTLIADAERVYYQNDNAIVALDRKTGKQLWSTERDKVRNRDSYNAPAMAVRDGVVLSADRSGGKKGDADARPWRYSAGAKNTTGTLIALDAATGKRLWTVPCAECYGATQDVFVINGLVYVGQDPRRHRSDFTRAYDLRTGAEKLALGTAEAFVSNHHHRCWRNKATPNYILMGRTGIEFIDVTGKDTVKNSWTRGTCQYGVMPANGLVYTPPHACGCYIQVKLSGFFAYAPRGQQPPFQANRFATRLVKGPAYAKAPPAGKTPDDDWPTYRGNPSRDGRLPADLPTRLSAKWSAVFDGPVTGAVCAGGAVYLAETDRHTLWAVSAATGKKLWSFVADGLIDSAPTVADGRVLFGTRGGSVYALRTGDGELAWRFRAAGADIQHCFDGQLQSLWPVHGSVLVADGAAYVAAGRSSYVDDGLYLLKLDTGTGKLLAEKRIYSRDKTGRPAEGRGQSYPGGLADILSCDGEHIFMRDVTFTPDCEQLKPTVDHIHSAAGYLDDDWAHRTYWFYGSYMQGGYGGWHREGNRRYSGRIMVRDDERLFGYGRTNYFNDFRSAPRLGRYRDQSIYRLYAAPLKPDPKAKAQPAKRGRKGKKRGRRGPKYTWTVRVPVYVRAMVLADNALFLAGPRHILEDKTADDPKALAEQVTRLRGGKGAELLAVSPETGEVLSTVKLSSAPVFDGMIAAGGRLFVSTLEGTLICLGQ